MKFFRQYISGLLSTFYPQHCMVCNTYIEDNEFDLCIECWKSLPLIGASHCLKCGAYLGPYVTPTTKCSKCKDQLRNITKVYALFKYEETSKKLIHTLKFKRKRHIAYGLGKLLAYQLKSEDFIKDIDLIIPIPLHWKREYIRTFNQSEILASTISKKLNIPYNPGVIVRKRATTEQAKLSHAERRRNLTDAFALSLLKKHKVFDRTILLIDDVMTTGTTMTECARVLKKGNPKKIYGAVLCRA